MERKLALIIEDDAALAELYRERLEIAGYRVHVSPNGEDGVEKSLSARPHIILLDLLLPGKGGMNVLQILKTEPVTKNIPVIVLTALTDDKYKQQSLGDGAAAHFVKSQTTPEAIVKKVYELLQ